MVPERFFGAAINPERIVFIVVIFVINISVPAGGAFYAEMVVRHPRQFAVTVARFKKALGQCYARGYTVGVHFLYGYCLIPVNILQGGKRCIV